MEVYTLYALISLVGIALGGCVCLCVPKLWRLVRKRKDNHQHRSDDASSLEPLVSHRDYATSPIITVRGHNEESIATKKRNIDFTIESQLSTTGIGTSKRRSNHYDGTPYGLALPQQRPSNPSPPFPPPLPPLVSSPPLPPPLSTPSSTSRCVTSPSLRSPHASRVIGMYADVSVTRTSPGSQRKRSSIQIRDNRLVPSTAQLLMAKQKLRESYNSAKVYGVPVGSPSAMTNSTLDKPTQAVRPATAEEQRASDKIPGKEWEEYTVDMPETIYVPTIPELIAARSSLVRRDATSRVKQRPS